jgi:hypothetical protein
MNDDMSFRRASRNLTAQDDSEDDNDNMSAMTSPTKLYSKPKASRGRSDEVGDEGGRSASRSRSRSSSVLRKLIGGVRKGKKPSDDGMSVASGMSVATSDTKSSKFKIKKIKRLNDTKSISSDTSLRDDDTLSETKPRKRSSSSDGTRHRRSSSADRTRPKRSSSSDRARPKRSSSTDRAHHGSFQRPVSIDEHSEGSFNESYLEKKLRKKSKLKYKSRRVSDSGGVDSDGDYGAADSDGDNGSVDTRSIGSEGILSPRRNKVRRKRKPKKSSFDDDATVGSSKVSLADSYDYGKTPKASSSKRIVHEEKVASIPGPPMSPEGVVIQDEMDNLFPSPKSEKKKLPRVKRKGKQENPLPPSGKEEPFSPIVDRTPGARPSDYKNRISAHQNKLHDSGLTIDTIPQELPTSNRSNKSMRNSGKNIGDSDTILSMSDTVTSLNKHLEEQREENRDLRKQLTDALTKIASLNEELRRGETSSLNEKAELLKSINDMREDSIAKDERIDKLQHVVETQLDTIEFLEEKLEQTEDELLKVENELKALDDGGLLDQSVHAKGVLKRKGSIQQNKITRKGSIQARNEESRSVLRNDGNSTKRSREESSIDDLEEREAKVFTRENQLDEWEKNLVKFDVQIRNSSKSGEEEVAFKAKLQLMEKRERRMEENYDSLVQEKENLVEKVQQLENRTRFGSINESISEDEDVQTLKRSISELEKENKCLLNEISDMKRAKMEDVSKITELESVKQDLLVKLDHVRSTAIRDEEKHQDQIASLEEELKLLQKIDGDGISSGYAESIRAMKEQMDEKEAKILELEETLKRSRSTGSEEDEGKDMLIRELQNQLVAAKKEAHDYSSGDYTRRLKIEVKTLKQGYNDLKKRMKRAEMDAQAELKKKEEGLKSTEREMAKLRRDLERLEKREKNLGTGGSIEEEGLRKHIEDLEDEIDHWKATNANLENELDLLKSDFSERRREGKNEEEDFDDDLSIGSLQSLNSHMSEQRGLDHSSELFFISDSNSVRSNRPISVGLPPPPGEEPSTPSQRALRSVSNLWSKMKSEPAPLPVVNTPYSAGMLDDDST